jgi:SAM-dependent methyltransferase
MENNQIPQNFIWASGKAYEPFVGRWSRLVARDFLAWLAVPAKTRWLDVGCGTGALSRTILDTVAPDALVGVDPSQGYLAFARDQVRDKRAWFAAGDAQALPVDSASYDAVVSGLALNFIPQPHRAVEEMARAARPGGVVAAYVWDYAGKMQFMRYVWNAAAALDPAAGDFDEGRRFPLCKPDPLDELFRTAGLQNVAVRPIDIATDFRDFDDFWSPFLGGQGPTSGYILSLSDAKRATLRDRIKSGLPFSLDGSLPLVARAWAVRGFR